MADLEQACQWLREHGRPIDQALVEFAVSNDPAPVLADLSMYQNSDGGFGQALEPDVRLADSSVLATTIALQILTQCNVEASDHLVRGAMGYLDAAFDEQTRAWPIVPNNVTEAAHAPWWQVRPPGECLINPRAEIVAYMYVWPENSDGQLRTKLTAELMKTLADATTLEMHDVLVFNRLLRTPNFPRQEHRQQSEHFYALAKSLVATTPEEWQSYGLTPLSLIDAPDHPLAAPMDHALRDNFQHLNRTQCEDGSWASPWTWHGAFDDKWPDAELDIKSLVTRENVNLYRRFSHLITD